MSSKQENRCWPGYEPVAGKKPNSQGSCRPKPESKSTAAEKDFKGRRRKQLDKWEEEHPKSKLQAAQHLRSPDQEPKASRPAKKAKPAKKRAATTTKGGKPSSGKTTKKAVAKQASKTGPKASAKKKIAAKKRAA